MLRPRTRHADRIVLVGEAAHAMTPDLGQGAAQTLEDVAALAARLKEMALSEALRATNATGALRQAVPRSGG